MNKLGILGKLWENRENIKKFIEIAQIVIKHVDALIKDLQDDGKLNGSVK